MSDYQDRIRKSIEAFNEKNDPARKKRSNSKPEKKVEADCLKWLRDSGFSIDVFESKATYNPNSGRYISQSMKSGITDSIGCDPFGHACFIEFKAPGRLSTLRENQRDFLVEKINHGAFGCVVDSVEKLVWIYKRWKMIVKSEGVENGKGFLLKTLPSERSRPKTEGLHPCPFV